jgi:hypothetical protein
MKNREGSMERKKKDDNKKGRNKERKSLRE